MNICFKKKYVEKQLLNYFLTEKAPELLSNVGEFLPDQGALGVVKNIITSDTTIEPKDKETALKLLDQDIAEMDNISNRWMNDMRSDSWLSKNTRPLTLIFLTFAMTIFVILDSTVLLEIKTGWVSLLEALLITVYVAYFGSRGAERITKIKN